MNRFWDRFCLVISVFTVFCVVFVSQARADVIVPGTINLFVDAAPNVYGSPNYAGWWSDAKADAADGSFVNMANSYESANAGTLNFELEDAVVYSFGDLGHRLHFVYYVPEETIADLITKHFQVSLFYNWAGTSNDFYGDYYGSTWLTPSSWSEYNGGVIGTAGFAWWGAYGINTPEALAADLTAWRPNQGDISFFARMDGTQNSLTVTHGVPEPTTMLLLSLGFIGLIGFRKPSSSTSPA